jgi:Flp pilus assembly pilin Flp
MLVWDRLRAFLKDESGATAIEYGLIAADIAVAVIAVVNGLDEETEYQIHVDLDAIELGRGPSTTVAFSAGF